jgi:hypothetical protein
MGWKIDECDEGIIIRARWGVRCPFPARMYGVN